MSSKPLRRSQLWFGGSGKDGFIHRSWMKNQGLPDDSFDGRPVIGICNTWSELTPCNHHFRELAQRVKQGVLQAGGLPLEFPVSSLGESLMRPTAMLFRNLASMDVEEAIRANPLDGVVLLAGCDKTTPATLMGAASVDLPTILVSGGPMLNGRYRGQRIGSGTHVWKFSEDVKVLVREAFENAVRVCGAIGGSTNAVLHLLAIAGRIGVPLSLDDWDRLGRGVPTIVNLMPSGEYLMEDFFEAGGLPLVMKRLLDAGVLHGGAPTVALAPLAQTVDGAECFDDAVIRPLAAPLVAEGGLAVLRGNLAPDGAVIKPSAASPALMRHVGRPVVFENIEHYKARIDDPTLPVDASSVMVLKGCGPRGYPGMAEVGNMGLPPKLLRQGITDLVRLSDARMSGTAYGTVVLHIAPEAAAGGPLALVEEGDEIELDVPARKLELRVPAAELQRRQALWRPAPLPDSGYLRLYAEHVQQANLGADFDFLRGRRGDAVARESH